MPGNWKMEAELEGHENWLIFNLFFK